MKVFPTNALSNGSTFNTDEANRKSFPCIWIKLNLKSFLLLIFLFTVYLFEIMFPEQQKS